MAFALEAALRGGRSTLAHFGTEVQIDSKQDTSPVTVADRDAERIIREMIAERYPKDSVLGEEEGGDLQQTDGWVIDPIDGTKSFVCGVPLYATLLSYEEAGETLLGVCYFPALGEMLYAERGGGAFFNGRPCQVSERRTVAGSYIASGSPGSMKRYGKAEGFEKLVEKALAARTWSDAYGHALVATGRVDAMIDPILNPWDVSAVRLIVTEAKGRCTDFSGKEGPRTEAISSNGWLHDELLEAFRA
jgi:histidinol-phosphatase